LQPQIIKVIAFVVVVAICHGLDHEVRGERVPHGVIADGLVKYILH
jgi:hypothetical protein